MSSEANTLDGAKVLVLEDETLVSMMIEDMLGDIGCTVIGPFARVDDALRFLENAPALDLALLDVNLAGVHSFPVAQALAKLNVPFVFTTGYDDSAIPPEWRSRPTLRKPFVLREMEETLKGAVGR